MARIRALSLTDRVVYTCIGLDRSNPCSPQLEVDARTLPGDLEGGPLLLSLTEYAFWTQMGHGHPCVAELYRKGRIADHLGSPHVTFPTWEVLSIGP